MKTDLDNLKDEIQALLSEHGIAVFPGYWRTVQSRPAAYWDTSRYPDFRPFLDIARQTGVKVVVLNHLEFSRSMLDDAGESLQECDLPPDERRGFERKLKDLHAYEGFTCTLQVSYDIGGCRYVYEIRAGWYAEFLSILDELDDFAMGEDDEDEDEDSVGGYFSRN